MTMTNKIYTIEEIKSIVKPVLEKYPKIKSLYIYSDYALGTATPNSPMLFYIEGDSLTIEDTLTSPMRDELENSLCKETAIYMAGDLLYSRMDTIKKEWIKIYGLGI